MIFWYFFTFKKFFQDENLFELDVDKMKKFKRKNAARSLKNKLKGQAICLDKKTEIKFKNKGYISYREVGGNKRKKRGNLTKH